MPRPVRYPLAACAALPILGFSSVVLGYNPIRTNEGNPVHWIDQIPATPAVIDIYYDFRNPVGFTNLITPVQKSLAIQAMNDWSAVTGGRIVFTQNTTAASTLIINISVGDLAAVGGVSGPGGTLGNTALSYFASGQMNGATVQVDSAELWDLTLGNGNPDVDANDFYGTAVHELGHALGLGHSDFPFANVMNTFDSGEKLGPSRDDIDGMNFLYNGNPNYNAITRTIASFSLKFNGNYNYYDGSPSTFYYYVDSGVTNVTGDTSVLEESQFHQSGGIWNTNTVTIGSAGQSGPGLFDIAAGTFNASSNVSITANSIATLSGGAINAGSNVNISANSSVTISGGTFNASGVFSVGGNSFVTISSGYLNLPSGSLSLAGSGIANFNFFDGRVSAGTLINRQAGSFQQSSGSLTLAVLDHRGGTFAQYGGTAAISVITQSGGSITLGGPQEFYAMNSLTISDGKLTLPPDAQKTLRTTAISITGGGLLDLQTAKLIVHTLSPADKTDKINALLNDINVGAGNTGGGDAWTSEDGITSSAAALNPVNYAVGLFDNGVLGKTSVGGQPVTSADLFISVARLGDTNLDGIIDINDLGNLANSWQQSNATWSRGDFNRNGFVDINDLGILASNWQQTSIFPLEFFLQATAAVNVPEPASLAVLLLAGPLLLHRRRY